MSANIIDGKKLAADLRGEITARTSALKEKTGIVPGLAVILIGENPASVSADDIEMLEDLITSAMKTATEKSKSEMESKMKSVTGGVNIPGLTL